MSKSVPNERTRLLPSEDSDSEDGIAPPAGSLNAEPNLAQARKRGAKEKQPVISKSSRKAQLPAPAPDVEHFAPKKPTRRIPTGFRSLLFWGVGDIASVGSKQEIKPGDLYSLEKEDQTTTVTKRLEKRWALQRGRKSMSSAVLRTWGWALFLIMLRLVTVAILQYTGVILVPKFVDWLKDTSQPVYLGWVYTSVTIFAALCVRLLNTNGNAHAYRVSWQVRRFFLPRVYAFKHHL
eukprot:TRINITY_DN989_c0_g1_i4.p1 TRINITY_DN989_c0_g1~~TRINITY_DN989_c0_g1_i4.p1  ORF type:complete len:236 (-),score=24.47 TRINITY_DN989_c0_g1_i4:161-868(-)